ncbi:hypothetical protein [Caulobacter hibisci]|uniref:Lipoprotein n=1 Tax=Caulobacter hibisci TaxID=2035993 RepID=A0ABS0SST7_9CAUL|nr:hypothetical protein [Caulobacter hibisci]MBI1682416.1 hypothetical protein [Caulobacter hibisci]
MTCLVVAVQACAPNAQDQRRAAAREAAAAAGFADARFERGQSPTLLSLCDVGQVRKRGWAFHWRTEAAEGLYCARDDGRADTIILLEGSPPSAPGGGAPIETATPQARKLARTVR